MTFTPLKIFIVPTILLVLGGIYSCKKTATSGQINANENAKTANNRTENQSVETTSKESGAIPMCKLDDTTSTGPVAGC